MHKSLAIDGMKKDFNPIITRCGFIDVDTGVSQRAPIDVKANSKKFQHFSVALAEQMESRMCHLRATRG